MANTENTVMPALEGYMANENFVDETLSRAGAAADAKEVGDRLQKMDTAFDRRMTDMDEAYDRQMDALESNIDKRLESMNSDIEKIEGVVDEKAENYLDQISESTANSLAQFEETSSEKLEQMEEKGKQVLGTLPDDYLELEGRVGKLSEEIEEKTKNIQYIKSANLCNPAEIETGKMLVDGTIESSELISHTGFIEVKEGDSVGLFRNNDGVVARIYRVQTTVFDVNKNVIPDKGVSGSSNTPFTIPEGVKYVVFSFANTYTEPMVAIDYTVGEPFVHYFEPHYSYADDFLTAKTKEVIQNLPLRGKTIVNFGDSIFAKRSAPTDISSFIAQLTGATVHNCAFSGCRMAEIGESYESTNAFSMVALTDAIISGDFSRQEAVIGETTEDEASLKRQHLTNLENVDFTKVDIVTIAYGTNDWTSGVGLTSYGNALSYAIEKILTTYPTVQIFVCLPTFRWKASEETESGYVDTDGDEWTNSITGLKLRDFIEKARTISESYRVQVIDNYYGLGLNRFNTYLSTDWKTFYTDNTHPNARGSKLIAEHIVNELY